MKGPWTSVAFGTASAAEGLSHALRYTHLIRASLVRLSLESTPAHAAKTACMFVYRRNLHAPSGSRLALRMIELAPACISLLLVSACESFAPSRDQTS
jgi:hypothetical protein